MGFDWGKLAETGMKFAGSQGAARGQSSLEKKLYEQRKQAYDDMIGRSKGDFSAGETAFLDEANQALPELQQMENQITSGGSEALQDTSKQMQLGIAQQGLRGGQAATQLRRGLGDVGKGTIENINKMKFDEASQRAGERRGYQSGKAARGQQTSYTPPTF